jgi:hypothetical protein
MLDEFYKGCRVVVIEWEENNYSVYINGCREPRNTFCCKHQAFEYAKSIIDDIDKELNGK